MNIFAALPIQTGFIDLAMANFGEDTFDETVLMEFTFLLYTGGF